MLESINYDSHSGKFIIDDYSYKMDDLKLKYQVIINCDGKEVIKEFASQQEMDLYYEKTMEDTKGLREELLDLPKPIVRQRNK